MQENYKNWNGNTTELTAKQKEMKTYHSGPHV